MLRAKVLPEVLGQIVGDGVSACMYVAYLHLLFRLANSTLQVAASFPRYIESYTRSNILLLLRLTASLSLELRRLVTLEGALVGSVGDGDAVDHKVVGAIASHTWGEYLHAGKEANPTGDLRTMLVELEASSAAAF
ncbi:hypothetical protein ON010_g1835 [Phytophthora cinnamomi]|nr:hypothetical protein ON010_g1835 [Phytophthora cinnamomi]